ncbi:unnamed protein product [Trifolium pratense]|uniref:Uncharacterized protein n=1 Tax=Trifolium pratense TaxID=57577 RepID=A0ACB0L1X0_TRIPR|nr:unnamed protein product [Trifolium pratense]
MVRGKKKATSPPVEKRAKKQKNAKGAKSKEGPRSTSVTSHWLSPHLLPPVLLDQPIPLEQRFVSEVAFKRIPVRGKQVPWSPAALNKLLGTNNLNPCPLVEKREVLKTASEAEKEEVKNAAIKALTVGQYRDYGKKRSHTVEADGDDNDGDSADEMNQLEDGTHLQQQQPQPHHDNDDIAALSTQLAIVEACNIPHVFYSEESTRYQAAKARLASFQHPPTYSTYPTRESLIAYHGIETA